MRETPRNPLHRSCRHKHGIWHQQQYVSDLFALLVLNFAQLSLELVKKLARRYARLPDSVLTNGLRTLTLDARQLGYRAVRKRPLSSVSEAAFSLRPIGQKLLMGINVELAVLGKTHK